MAISSSLITKVGAASTATAGVGLGGTYLAWDHITLYAVEREVISKDVRLTVGTPAGETPNPKKITVSISTEPNTNPSLEVGHTWTCEITIDSEAQKGNSYSNLNKYIQSHLQIPQQNLDDTQKHNKKLLVKACAKDRETKEDKNVKGKLTITKEGDKFTFKEHSYLDFLLTRSDTLYEVEEKVINENIDLSVGNIETSGENKTIKVKTESVTGWSETDGYWWECIITFSSNVSIANNTKLEGQLPKKGSESSDTKIKNKQALVKKCSKSRGDSDNAKKVRATLNLLSLSNVSTEEVFLSKLFDENKN